MNWVRVTTVSIMVFVSAALIAGCQSSRQMQSSADLLQVDQRPEKVTRQQAADMQVSLGRSLEAKGQATQAIAAYQAAIKQNSRRADAYVRLAILQDQQGKFQESAKYYSKALKLEPGNADIYCDKGYSLYLQHRWEGAEMNLRQALAIQHNHERAHNNLGLVFAHTERFAEAIAEFQSGGSSPADARANLAFCLTLDRRWDEARQNYEIALAEDPSSASAKDGLRQLNLIVAKNTRTKLPVDAPATNHTNLAAFERIEPKDNSTPDAKPIDKDVLILTEVP